MPTVAYGGASIILLRILEVSIDSPSYHSRHGKGKDFLVPAMKAYKETEVQFHSFLNSALDGVSNRFHAPAALLPETQPRLNLQ